LAAGSAQREQTHVLKIKPPLCIDQAGVDCLLEALEVAFTQAW
jgi:4-aminobutyrate aminotransferase-like enzyme